ncbi:MAG: phage major capsid protein [Candidatus Eisenbacteria bacterium]|nr:phage major capsid protein [Candidatus Eisenbacteria bacterium]
MPAFTGYVTTVTNDHFVPVVTDTVLGGNVLTARLIANGKRWVGETLRFPVKTVQNTSGGSFFGGDTLLTTQVNTRQLLGYDLRQWYHAVVIANAQRAVNSGDAAVINLVKTEMESAAQDMIDDIGDIVYGNGTGNDSKNFLGMQALIDDGTNVATIGGLARATFTTLQSTLTPTIGVLEMNDLAVSYDAATEGKDHPTLIVCPEAVWRFFEGLHQPTIRANYDAYQVVGSRTPNGRSVPAHALSGEQGFSALNFRGVPVVADSKATAGTMWFINEDYVSWYGLPHPDAAPKPSTSSTISGVYSKSPAQSAGIGLSWSGWRQPTNQDVVVGYFFLYGNLVTRNPARCSVMTGITG